jgi:cell division protein FtsB
VRIQTERVAPRVHPPAAPRVPDAERAREASLRQRNTTLLAENRRLRDQIAELKTELAIAYGHRRAAN